MCLCLFNVGFAAIQLAHLSVIPSCTASQSRKDQLVSLRTMFTFTAGVLSIGIATFWLELIPDMATAFLYIMNTAGIVATTCGFIFIIFFREQTYSVYTKKY